MVDRRGREEGEWQHTFYALLIGSGGLALLIYWLATAPQEIDWLPILVFTALSLLVQRSSFHLGSPQVHSLAGVIDVAAVLALGPAGGASVAALSGLGYLELSAARHRRFNWRYLLERPFFNGGLKALIALVSAFLYLRIDGPLPLAVLDGETAVACGVVALTWFLLDHAGWAVWDYLEGGVEQLKRFACDAFPMSLFTELLPLPFSAILALVYTRLGWAAFGLLSAVIVAVAVLVQRWAVARNELVQRVAELSTIEQVGREIAQAELDVDELAMLMYECTRDVADATIFHLGLFRGDEYTLKLWMRDGERVPEQTFRLPPGVGLVTWMRDTGQPLLVRDFVREMETLPARPAYVSDDPPRSAVYVPLIAGETVVGTMSVQSFRRGAYGDGELRVLQAMANQAAVAMQKAQLYEQERKRVRQLETIQQVSYQVTATLELKELFPRVVRLIRANFCYYHVAIYSATPARRRLTFQASASAGECDVTFDVGWGEGLIGWVAEHGEPALVNDVANDPRYRNVNALAETESELAVPLLLEDDLVGVLDVQSDHQDAFGPDDLFSLETLGTQIAIAIQQARLYEAEQQQAWLSTALLQVADAMSQVPDMDAVLTTIVRLTPILAGVDRCAILLWDEERERFTPAQTYGLAREKREMFEQMVFSGGVMPALDVLRVDKSVLLVGAGEDGGLIPEALAEAFDVREAVFLPLLAQGELLGAMMVDYAGREHHFSERVVGMLTGITNQAAMVLQTARLVQAQQEEAYVSMALLQVAEAVSRSPDLAGTLASVVRITPILVGVEVSAILVWDPGLDLFLPAEQYGLDRERAAAFEALRVDRHDPLAQAVLAGKAFVHLEELPTKTAVGEVVSEAALVLPLLSKGDVLGMMVVDYADTARHVTERWLNILAGIAGQAAIAVENARLLEEAAEQERMRQELEVAKRIQKSFLPEECPEFAGWELAAIWRAARQVGGDFYDFVPLARSTPPPAFSHEGGEEGHSPRSLEGEGVGGRRERLGLVIADVADKGVPAALFMALSRTLVRTMAIDGRPPAAAIERANDLIISDARAELFVTLFYAVLEENSGQVKYVNGGHVPPLVGRAGGKVEELRVPGMALGVLRGTEYQEWQVSLAPGDVLVLYTDGVTDALGAEEEMFGRDRLVGVVRAHRGASAAELAQAIDDAVASFVGDVAAFDDFTLVIAKRSV
ncbi:MAG: GAF domain-containing protein [Anaerolineae bacterium]|nr:GAF domain-containing protein [Anaerolineae bacterium]